MNFADIFDICRTGSCIYLPCTVSTSDNGFCNGNPRIVVAEDSGIFFISWWIRGNLTKFYMVSVIRWLKKYNTVFSIQIFFYGFHGFQTVSFFQADLCHNAEALWLDKNLTVFTFFRTNLVFVMIICTQEPFSVPAGIKNCFFHFRNGIFCKFCLVFKSSVTADLYIIFTVTDKHTGNENRLCIWSFGWAECLEGFSRFCGEAV